MDSSLTTSENFTDFGPDPYFPYPLPPMQRVDGEEHAELRKAVRQFAPNCPGVYGMLDPLGRLIYVGKSKRLRGRLLSYFLPKDEDDKSGRIIDGSHAIVWQPQPSEFAALLREQYLIRRFQPRFNVQGIPKRQQPIYICLGKAPAEYLFTSRQPVPDTTMQLGPLYGASRASRAVEVLNRHYKLRDCSSKQPCGFSDQLQLFDIELRPGCLRLEIDTCLGPCINACSRGAYEKHVGMAKAFLLGRDDSPSAAIELQMHRLAQQKHYERAGVLRDDLRCVRWLTKRAGDIKSAKENYTFVYAVKGVDCGKQLGMPSEAYDIWYLIRRGVLEGAIAPPLAEAARRRVRSRLRRWIQGEETVGGDTAARPETLALITSWFRNHTAELEHAFVPGAQRAPSRRRSLAKKKTKLSG